MTESNAQTSQVFYPVLRYHDAHAAIAWLKRGFGFEERAVYLRPDGTVEHAELRLGEGLIMLGSFKGGDAPGSGSRGDTPVAYVFVADVDAHYARAKGAGAQIVRDLVNQSYGSREYSALDCEGNRWSFGTYRPA